MDDDLGDHGVVEGGDGGAGFDPGFDAGDGGRRESHECELAGRGLEVVGGIFGVDAGFDRCAARVDVEAGEWRHFACGLEDHPLDEVDAGDFFGDAVLDLESGVDFEEVELLGVVVVDELDGAGGGVVDGFGEEGCGGEEAGPGFVRQAGCWGLFEDFLVAALGGAVALAEGEDVAVAVAEDLDLDVTGAGDVFFEVDAGVAEVGAAEAEHGVPGLG